MRVQPSREVDGLGLAVLTLKEWKQGTWSEKLPARVRKRIEAAARRQPDPVDAGSRFVAAAAQEGEEDFWVAVLPKEEGTYWVLQFARDTLKEVVQPRTKSLNLVIESEEREEQIADAFGSALAVRVFPMPRYGKKDKERKPFQLKDIELTSPSDDAVDAFERGYLLGEGTNIARRLATIPPNFLDPAAYGREIQKLCRELGLQHKFHSKQALKRMGAGAFTAVDQGNPASAGGIHEISYSPRGARNSKPVTFVGKGMCYDTGGYDVKTGGHMKTMKGDMQGSAIALASIATAARLELPVRMKAYLAVTENHLSPVAYKADDVVTALNGVTIEVINTDAEGRMVLADTLALASRDKPLAIIDFATLTGTAVRAIGTKIAAGFTNRAEWHERIRVAGEKSGERVWTFPIDPVYFKALESEVADTLQCAASGSPDHIMAACFLSRFVAEGTPWVHIDTTYSENEGGAAHSDSTFTGLGVRFAHEFVRGL